MYIQLQTGVMNEYAIKTGPNCVLFATIKVIQKLDRMPVTTGKEGG